MIGGTRPNGLSDGFMHRWDGKRWIRGAVPLPFGPSLGGVPDSARTVWNGEAYFFGGSRSSAVVIYNPLYDW